MQKAIKNFSHAYLICGSSEKTLKKAEEIIENLGILRVDILNIKSEDASIKIQEIRELIHFINLKPHSGKYKLAMIYEAQKMTKEAANSLLKTLEEPPSYSIIILLANNCRAILPTVASRCRKAELRNSHKIAISAEEIEQFEKIKQMSVKEKFDLASKIAQDEELKSLFDKWLTIFRKKMFKKQNFAIIKKVIRAQRKLEANINKRLLLENILLEM